MFATQYSERKRVFSNCGSRIKEIYTSKYDSFGILRLEKTGSQDLYGFIQASKDEVDLKKILERFTAGDKDALTRAQGIYADITGVPTTYAEVLNSLAAGERVFSALPASVKETYGSSFSRWLADMDQPGFLERSGFATGPKQPLSENPRPDFGLSPEPAKPAVPLTEEVKA